MSETAKQWMITIAVLVAFDIAITAQTGTSIVYQGFGVLAPALLLCAVIIVAIEHALGLHSHDEDHQ